MYSQLEQRGIVEPPVNVATFTNMKSDGQPIACLTAYDASYALLVDKAGVDLVLVGDSLGMVIQGHDTTIPVTVSDIIYHTKNVARGLQRAFLVSDMPFMSYVEPAQALDNAVQMMQDCGAMMIKLEGGDGQVAVVEHLAKHDIPVCAHLGLKPQSVHKIGGFKVQGREANSAKQMIEGAKILQDAGADLLLLECVPNEVGQMITEKIQVPVIGIGAGPFVDGQILVLYDILGITQGRTPRFVQNFMKGQQSPLDAIRTYVQAIRDRKYPAPEHCFS